MSRNYTAFSGNMKVNATVKKQKESLTLKQHWVHHSGIAKLPIIIEYSEDTNRNRYSNQTVVKLRKYICETLEFRPLRELPEREMTLKKQLRKFMKMCITLVQ